jgi:hypothetical protein
MNIPKLQASILAISVLASAATHAQPTAFEALPGPVKQIYATHCMEGGLPAAERKVQLHTLSDNHRLMLVDCYRGAYNTAAIGFMQFVPDGQWRMLSVPQRSYDSSWTAVTMLYGAHYDTNTGLLSTFMKHRGLGDCWTRGEYYFQHGQAYLTRMESKPCDGSMNLGEDAFVFEYTEPD